MITAIILINAELQAIDRLGKELANIDNVAEVYTVTGDYDFVVIVRCKDYERISETVVKNIARLDGIKRTNTMMAFQCISRYDMESMWSIGLES